MTTLQKTPQQPAKQHGISRHTIDWVLHRYIVAILLFSRDAILRVGILEHQMIIVIASAKGGSGKTTTAMHLAEWLSRKRSLKRVVLMDADPDNRSASKWYGRGDGWKFELIPPGDEAGSEFDALVVDAGAAPDSDELGELLEGTDLLLIPTAPTTLDIESAVEVASGFNDDGSVKLLVTLAQPGRSQQGPDAITALQEFELPVCPHIVYRRTVVANAATDGTTVADMRGKAASQAWKEYQTAFKWLVEGLL